MKLCPFVRLAVHTDTKHFAQKFAVCVELGYGIQLKLTTTLIAYFAFNEYSIETFESAIAFSFFIFLRWDHQLLVSEVYFRANPANVDRDDGVLHAENLDEKFLFGPHLVTKTKVTKLTILRLIEEMNDTRHAIPFGIGKMQFPVGEHKSF